MKSMYRAALMVAAFVFLLPLSARSEIKAGSFEVGPFVGYNFFENNQNLKNRPVFGGRLGYNFTKHFGIEGAVRIYPYQRVDDKAKTGLARKDNSEVPWIKWTLLFIISMPSITLYPMVNSTPFRCRFRRSPL